MGHLDSQLSLTAFGEGRTAFSSTAKKLRLAVGQKVGQNVALGFSEPGL
jgi:hypothetical protein